MSGFTRPLMRVPGLAALADRQLGIVHRDQLRGLGVTSDHVDSHLRAQRWTAEAPTVVSLMTGPPTWDQRLWIAHLHAGPRSAVAGRTALMLRGLRGWEDDDVHLVVPHGCAASQLPGVVQHQTRRDVEEMVSPFAQLPCQNAAAAAVLAGSLERSSRSASGLVLATVQQRLTTGDQVLLELKETYRPKHAAAMRAAAADGGRGSDSLAEADAARLAHRAGLRDIRRQAVVATADGPRRVDLRALLPDGSVLVIEVDGVHHADPRQQSQDLTKDAAVIAAGGQVLRVTALMLRTDAWGVLRQLISIREAAERRSGGL